jgi:hypothetical protein
MVDISLPPCVMAQPMCCTSTDQQGRFIIGRAGLEARKVSLELHRLTTQETLRWYLGNW